jgi:hypothetical protein
MVPRNVVAMFLVLLPLTVLAAASADDSGPVVGIDLGTTVRPVPRIPCSRVLAHILSDLPYSSAQFAFIATSTLTQDRIRLYPLVIFPIACSPRSIRVSVI